MARVRGWPGLCSAPTPHSLLRTIPWRLLVSAATPALRRSALSARCLATLWPGAVRALGRQRTVRYGRDGEIAWRPTQLLFGRSRSRSARSRRRQYDGIRCAERAYAQLVRFVRDSDTPHLLRIWNYLDAITLGDGDTERYRQFCVGRARGLGDFDASGLPAATAIGRCDDDRTLQVYWLAARESGMPVENPRQVSAYRYPREYGPQSPSFARAMLPPPGSTMPLLLSGTASVVGHASLHSGALLAQLNETFANFDSLLAAARARQPSLPAQFAKARD